MAGRKKILVIRLGALGDLVLCFQAFASIRQAHPDAEIALLTSPQFAGFVLKMPWFNRVIIDNRPSIGNIPEWFRLVRSVRGFYPELVYDLQGKLRQSILYAALGGPFKGRWSGAAPFCTYPRVWPPKPEMHFTDFINAQLKNAGVKIDSDVSVSWLDAPLDHFALPQKYAVIIPGCAPNRLYKRWPAYGYAALVEYFKEKGLACVAVGTVHDAPAIADIKKIAADLIDLSGKTTLSEVASLARRSVCVVGNDTGPTHLAAAVGANVVTLMSEKVNPVWSAPKGQRAVCLQGKPLSSVAPEEVIKIMEEFKYEV